MFSRFKKTFFILIVLIFILSGGLFFTIKDKFFFKKERFSYSPKPEIGLKTKDELQQFLIQYLDTYKNIYLKKNYEELKNFLSQETLKGFFPNYLTDFDDYSIEEIIIPNFIINNQEDQYLARIKLFKNGNSIKPPSGETWPVFFVKENGKLKIKTLIFTLPLGPAQ